jgi:hypothetical protein
MQAVLRRPMELFRATELTQRKPIMNLSPICILCTAWMAVAPLSRAAGQDYPFFPFCIDWHDAKKRSFEEQAAMLKELGYPGVGHIWLDKVSERLQTLDPAGLKLYQITMTVEVAPGKQAYDPRFKDVLTLVKGRHVQFDLLLNGMKPSDPTVDPQAVAILREMSDLARESGSQLLLYPHQGSWVERRLLPSRGKGRSAKRGRHVQPVPLAARRQAT